MPDDKKDDPIVGWLILGMLWWLLTDDETRRQELRFVGWMLAFATGCAALYAIGFGLYECLIHPWGFTILAITAVAVIWIAWEDRHKFESKESRARGRGNLLLICAAVMIAGLVIGVQDSFIAPSSTPEATSTLGRKSIDDVTKDELRSKPLTTKHPSSNTDSGPAPIPRTLR